MEKARRKVEVETARFEVELLLEIGATKDEVCSLQPHVSKDKEAIEEDYQKAMEVIFVYGYGCCTFKHSIYGDLSEVPDSMPRLFRPVAPPKFFMNPKCLPVLAAIKDTTAETHLSEAV